MFGASSTAQEEREYAIKAFKAGKKDVMVASGVASKVPSFLIYIRSHAESLFSGTRL